MTWFPGFAVSGYRSLYGEPQWIPFGAGLTVVLGANNSGKSNVLGLLHRHSSSLHSAISRSSTANFDPRLDGSRGAASREVEVHWPIDTSGWDDRTANTLEALLNLDVFNQFGRPAVPAYAESLESKFEYSIERAAEIEKQTSFNWRTVASNLTGTSGGSGSGINAQQILNWLRSHLHKPPPMVLVPPFRSTAHRSVNTPAHDETDDDNEAEWDFGGSNIVDRLHRIRNPEHDEDLLRRQDAALTADLAELLEDGEVRWGVPHDKSSLNVRIGGEYFPLESLGSGTEQAILILAAHHIFPSHAICLEEPDAHLHPRLQRRLMNILRRNDKRQLLVATHSAQLLDMKIDRAVGVRMVEGRSEVEEVGSPALFAWLRDLGYRASDILQSDAIVWVEGPSDRVYLLHWLRAVAPELVEGVHFSIMFYCQRSVGIAWGRPTWSRGGGHGFRVVVASSSARSWSV